MRGGKTSGHCETAAGVMPMADAAADADPPSISMACDLSMSPSVSVLMADGKPAYADDCSNSGMQPNMDLKTMVEFNSFVDAAQ